MSVLLGLLAAATYGSSDFLAGLASRRLPPIVVTAGAQALCLVVGLIAVVFYSGDGLSGGVILWGAAGGVGSVGGTFALYRGLAGGAMSVVATLSGLLTAVIPVVVGLATGDSLSAPAAIGIVAAIPAIGLVSWQTGGGGPSGSGAAWGVLAGLGFGFLYVAYDRAGSAAGAWPMAVAEAVATLLAVGPALLALRARRVEGMALAAGDADVVDHAAAAGHVGAADHAATTRPEAIADHAAATRPDAIADRRSLGLLLAAGLLAGAANLSFIIANHHGELAVVAVLTALYPGFTVILARVVLGERWSSAQKLGLATALVATFLVSLGSA
jgi:drug/metabolite transporter (DMT)-like permease